MQQVTVSAAANVALVKYWGKLEKGHNQPATASLSIGLEHLRTETTLSYTDAGEDIVEAELSEEGKARVISFLDLARSRHEVTRHFHVQSANNFPTGSGLASSASRRRFSASIWARSDFRSAATSCSRFRRA